jgi:hypothetical protein
VAVPKPAPMSIAIFAPDPTSISKPCNNMLITTIMAAYIAENINTYFAKDGDASFIKPFLVFLTVGWGEPCETHQKAWSKAKYLNSLIITKNTA